MSPDSPARLSAAPFATEEAANPYLTAITRHWRLVLAIALITFAAAAFTVSRRTESYQTSASILVTPLSPTNADLVGIGAIVDSGDPARNVETAGALIDSPGVAAATAAAIGHGYTQRTVQTHVAVTPLGQSDVVSVTATAPSPTGARRLADTFAQTALAQRSRVVQARIGAELSTLTGQLSGAGPGTASDIATRINSLRQLQGNQDPTLALASLAEVPTSPTGASKWLILALALIGGLALGCVGALLMDRFSGRVRDEAEVAQILPVPVLTGLPRLSRVQVQQAKSPDTMPTAMFEQLRLLRAQLEPRVQGDSVMVTSADAGDGKTTVASSLAVAAAELGEQVILLDLDLHKPDSATQLQIPGRVGERALTNSRMRLEDVLQPAPNHPTLRVLASAQTDLIVFEAVIDRLPALLEEAKQLASWVIVDSPPLTAVSSGVRLVQVCDHVLFVVRPRHTDRSRLVLARDILARMGASVVGTVLVGEAIARLRPDYGYGPSDDDRDDGYGIRRLRRRRGRRSEVSLTMHD